MEPFILSFDPSMPQGVPITHDGQEFVYIVNGSVELYYNGRTYKLDRGGSDYLDIGLQHLNAYFGMPRFSVRCG